MKMQKVSLPPLRSSIHINTVSSREPPSRSWSRYKKLLIDNPKDSNLLQRQKLWNFQKLNRGAFRSQIASLPDIPYRVHTNTVEKCSVGIQVDLTNEFSHGLRVVFPNLTGKLANVFVDPESDSDDSSSMHVLDKACSPMHLDDADEYADDFEDDSSVDDPGFEFDTVTKIKNAGTMTDTKRNEKRVKKKDRKKKSLRDRNFIKEKQSILGPLHLNNKKSVTFANDEHKEAETQTPEVPIEESDMIEEEISPVIPKVEIEEKIVPLPHLPSPKQTGTGIYINLPEGNIGHSSQMSHDPLSVLDFLSGCKTDRIRNENRKQRAKKEKNKIRDSDADRGWFQQIVGDVEVVDTGTYDNFARIRPNIDSQSDSNQDRHNDFSKANSSRKNVTPRINSDFPQYYSLTARDRTQRKQETTNNMNKAKLSKRSMVNIGKFY